MRIELIAQPGRAPDALFGALSDSCEADVAWCGRFYQLQALGISGRLIERGIFAVDLSRRWGRLVICTPEFASWWRNHEGEPHVSERIFFKELIA